MVTPRNTEINVRNYNHVRGLVRLDFTDGTDLIVIPRRKYGQIEDLDSILLYQRSVLEALATEGEYGCSDYTEIGFWSSGKITQPQLANYVTVAVKIHNELFNRKNRGEIDEKTWDRDYWEFCRIIMETLVINNQLKEGRARVLAENPNRFVSQLGISERDSNNYHLVRHYG